MARGWWIVVLVLAGCGGDDDDGGDGAGTADAMAEGDAQPPPSTCDPAERQTRDRADEVRERLPRPDAGRPRAAPGLV